MGYKILIKAQKVKKKKKTPNPIINHLEVSFITQVSGDLIYTGVIEIALFSMSKMV
jgi:hypothetical protein